MLMLIEPDVLDAHDEFNLNTSNVNVNHLKQISL